MQKTSWGLVFALWAAGLGAAAQYGKFSVTFHLLPEIYPQAGTALGFVVSVVGFVGILFGVVAGLLVARIRYRRALLVALWAGAVLSCFQALLPPLPLLLASRLLEGMSHLAIVVAAPTLIAHISAPAHRGATLTLWGTFFGVAFALLAWLGEPLARASGVPALLFAHAVYMVACALFLSARLRALQVEPPPATSIAQILRNHAAIYHNPRIAAPALGWLFYTFCFVSLLTVLPPFLDAEVRATVMGAMPLVGIAVSMTLGVALLRVLSPIAVIVLGFIGALLATLWLWSMPGSPGACLALAGATGLVQGASFAAVPFLNTSLPHQAQANGAMAQMGNLGNTLGTPVMALAIALQGYNGMLLLTAAAFLCGGAVHVLLALRRRRA